MWEIVTQIASVLGACSILGAFFALQRGWWRSHDVAYLLLNLVGALVLTAVAIHDGRIGFMALEGVWAAVSLWSLLRRRRDPEPSPA